jgi:hypothetical protein
MANYVYADVGIRLLLRPVLYFGVDMDPDFDSDPYSASGWWYFVIFVQGGNQKLISKYERFTYQGLFLFLHDDWRSRLLIRNRIWIYICD